MRKNNRRVSGFAEELKKLCKRHKVGAFVAGVCRKEDKTGGEGVHRLVFYGNKRHCEEIMEDMVGMFTEIGIGKERESEHKSSSNTSNTFIYA